MKSHELQQPGVFQSTSGGRQRLESNESMGLWMTCGPLKNLLIAVRLFCGPMETQGLRLGFFLSGLRIQDRAIQGSRPRPVQQG